MGLNQPATEVRVGTLAANAEFWSLGIRWRVVENRGAIVLAEQVLSGHQAQYSADSMVRVSE